MNPSLGGRQRVGRNRPLRLADEPPIGRLPSGWQCRRRDLRRSFHPTAPATVRRGVALQAVRARKQQRAFPTRRWAQSPPAQARVLHQPWTRHQAFPPPCQADRRQGRLQKCARRPLLEQPASLQRACQRSLLWPPRCRPGVTSHRWLPAAGTAARPVGKVPSRRSARLRPPRNGQAGRLAARRACRRPRHRASEACCRAVQRNHQAGSVFSASQRRMNAESKRWRSSACRRDGVSAAIMFAAPHA